MLVQEYPALRQIIKLLKQKQKKNYFFKTAAAEKKTGK